MQNYRSLFILIAVLGVSILVASVLGILKADYVNFTWLSYLFLSLISLFVVSLGGMARKASPNKSVSIIMGAMGLKFLFSLFVIVLYVWVSKPQSAAFVLPFFVLYAIFAVFETKALIKNTDTRQETDDWGQIYKPLIN